MILPRLVYWHGTAAEFMLLAHVVRQNCTCVPNAPICGAHQLLNTQESLDHLQYVYTLRTRYQFEEHTYERTGE